MRHRIRLDAPAARWDTSLPIGNGRLGALIRGIPGQEIIHINEETLWYGGPNDRLGPDAAPSVEKVRQLLAQGDVEEANFQARIGMYSAPKYLSPYQPAGELRLDLRNHTGDVENYTAQLDIDNAVATVEYEINGVRWKREHIASRRANVIALRITNSSGNISLAANLLRRPFEMFSKKLDDTTTGLWGTAGKEGVEYFGALSATTQGGTVKTVNDYVVIENSCEVVLYLTFGTSFQNAAFRENALQRIADAKKQGYESLFTEHLNDFHQLYRRTSLSLFGEESKESSTANELAKAKEGHTDFRTLTETLFAFGKYLMICGSTDCVLPLNLQGIWNGSYTPRWESKYTININLQMNYWPAEPCQLSECHLPLFDLVDRMVERGKITARDLYGCQGFVAHHNTSIWADTDPEGIFGPSPIWPMGGAWLALHFYDHYDYTGDTDFLEQRALPVMEQSLLFFRDYLVEDTDGFLITGPSLSPENTYRTADGAEGSVCMGPTMDIQILRQLIECYLHSCKALALTPSFLPTAKKMLRKLPPTRLTEDGRIAEWQKDYEEVELGHRHMSHLFGLYPGGQMTSATPALMEGAQKTIDTRLAHGGAHTGWSRAWIICLLARLQQGEQAYHHIQELFRHSIQDNLFNSHPPYQIDGNFGFTAGVLEMLVQSHEPGIVRVLPALPKEWKNGSLTGIALRGALTADFCWENGKLTQCVLTSHAKDRHITVRYPENEQNVFLPHGAPVALVLS